MTKDATLDHSVTDTRPTAEKMVEIGICSELRLVQVTTGAMTL